MYNYYNYIFLPKNKLILIIHFTVIIGIFYD